MAPKQKAVQDHKEEGANGTCEMVSVQGERERMYAAGHRRD
jgi:hypothetical protein